MTPAPGFFLHHGNDLPALAHALGAGLTACNNRDWLLPDTVLIPQPSMRRWLQNSLAEQAGIAANLDFQLPGQMLDTVLQPWLPAPDPAMLLNGERCRWRIFTLLLDDGLMVNPAFARIKRFLHAADRQHRAWQLAGELAQTFEKYQAWRRDWLLSWHQKAVPGDWQSILWHLASQGRTFRAQAVEAYLNSLVNPGCPRPSGLPDHLSVFACQNLSPDVVRILQSFGRWIRVEFFLHNPCEAYWGDSGQRRSASDVLAMAFDNPLLDQWGYAGRDFVASLLSEQSAEWLGEAEHYRRPQGDAEPTLLQCLQDDVLNREAPKAGRMTRQALLSDASVQIHCCAGALREVQMLRGQLLALMQRNPELQWRDIVIMAPDLDRFAPYFAPVFGQTTADYPALPFALSETAATGTGLHGLVFRVLALARSRFTGNDGYELLAHPLLAETYDLSPDDLERLYAWLELAGVRWGLDAGHRMRVDGVSQNAFTWRFALERLIYGYASSDALIGDTAPVAMPAGKDRRLLDVLLAFSARIDGLQKQLNEPHDAEVWQEILQGLLAWLVADKPLEGADLAFFEQLQRLVSGLCDLADNAGLTHPFPVEVIASWLAEALEPRLGQAWLSGKITICKMVPMRLIPFKVVCVLGMDQSAFPRPEPVAAINRLADRATAARAGDRSNRNDDRFLMLQLLSSCRAHWIIGYSGLNPADGSESPPATVIQELRRTIAAYGPGDADTEAALTIRHPIHAFENPADARIAVLRDSGAKPPIDANPPMFAAFAKAHDAPTHALALDISLSEFTAFWKRPLETLAYRQDIRFGLHDRLLEASEPLGRPSGLARYHLVQAICTELGDTPDADPEPLLRRLQAEGRLAPGQSGRSSFFAVLQEIHPALQALHDDRIEARHFELEYAWNALRIHGLVRQYQRSGMVMPVLHKKDLQPKVQIAAGLQGLLAKAAGLDLAMQVRTACKMHTLSLPYSQQQAELHLQTLLGFYLQGQQRILCFDPDASFAWYQYSRENPDADVGVWIERQSAQDEQQAARRELGLIDVLTEGDGFLQAVAAREPEAFKLVSHTVCSILNGDAA